MKHHNLILTPRRHLRAALAVLAGTTFVVFVTNVQAQIAPSTMNITRPRNQSSLYYRLGGGDPAARAINRNSVAVRLGLGGGLRLNYSCGRFDIGLSWSTLMNNYATLGTTIGNAVKAGIAALPMYVFQRAQPGLYELFQTYSQKADAMIAASLKSCEEMEAQIRAGGDPYEEWVKLAKGEGWRVQAQTNGDVVNAKYRVEQDGGTTGMRWIGGQQRGGANMQPIRLIYDLVTAGYNVTANQGVLSGDADYQSPSVALSQSRLLTAFRRPSDAAKYAQDVLGEMDVSLCDLPQCPSKATSTGIGLAPKFEAEIPPIEATLNALAGTPNPNYGQLDNISAPGVAIGREVIDVLRELPELERGIALRRLAQEIALARTVDKALAIRNLLVTSLTLPEVTAADPASKKAQEKIAVLSRYIEDLMFENRVRKEVVSNTAAVLLDAFRGLQSQSISTQRQPRIDGAPLINGRVQ